MSKIRSAVCATLLAVAPAAAAMPPAPDLGEPQPLAETSLAEQLPARFQKDLQDRGIPATVESCRLGEQVAAGLANSTTAYGAACQIR